MQLIEKYFETATERYRIMLNKNHSAPKPWTEDKVLQTWRFCNVHREDDKTTRWFADNIRNKITDPVHVSQATVAFRWFNRIETGEKILDLLLDPIWNEVEARRRLKDVQPLVTGAYIIKGMDGFSKLDGVLECIKWAVPKLREMVPRWGYSLQGAWESLQSVAYLGPFMAYEIVSDLRWTPALNQAIDINLWANAGPGCTRGLGWVVANDPTRFQYGSKSSQKEMLTVMQLIRNKHNYYWPPSWKGWEMREVEHWACEFDKYMRAEKGEKLKRRYQ